MKKKQPAKGNAIVSSRNCKLIPEHLVSKLARKHGIDKQARTFSPWSHVVSLIYAQRTRVVGLNDVCDGLTHHATKLATIRGATPPKNTLTHTNKSRDQYPVELRRVEMFVELDGKRVLMAFITNNTRWAASTVGPLYKSRWGIEVFFKQIKQTLCISDFLGHNKNAIQSALLLYVLLRHQAQQAGWPHSFARLFTMLRGVIWHRICVTKLLEHYGTARGRWCIRATPETAYLPGLSPPTHGTTGGLTA